MRAYSEGSASTFSHQGKIGLVDDLIALASDKPIVQIPTAEVLWCYEQSKNQLDRQRVTQADPSVPVIAMKMSIADDHFDVVLDGTHRLAQIVEANRLDLSGRYITEAELQTILK